MSWSEVWQKFWFDPTDCRGYCLIRLIFGMMILYSFALYGCRIEDWIIMSSPLDPHAIGLEFMRRAPWSFFNYVNEKSSFYILYALHVIPVVLFTLGWGNRIVTFLAYLAFLSMCNRNPTILFGFDEYLGLFLLLFVFYPGMDRFSLKSWWVDRKGRTGALLVSGVDAICIRIFQVVFCVRYLSAGIYKPNDPWSDGSAIWQLLNNYEMQEYDFTMFHEYWGVFGWVSLSVKLFEIFFVPLLLFKPTRIPAIIYGVMMHLGIGIFTPLLSFALLMAFCYFIFLNQKEMDYLDRIMAKGLREKGVPTLKAGTQKT